MTKQEGSAEIGESEKNFGGGKVDDINSCPISSRSPIHPRETSLAYESPKSTILTRVLRATSIKGPR